MAKGGKRGRAREEKHEKTHGMRGSLRTDTVIS